MKIFSTSDPIVIKKLSDAGINPTNVVTSTSNQSTNFYEYEEDDARIDDILRVPSTVPTVHEKKEEEKKKSTIKEKINKVVKGKKGKR
jgi:hypothetical protein